MKVQVSKIKLHNTEFSTYYWKANNPKAIIVLVHGMGEHALRYENSVVKHLIEDEFSVFSYDNFGHGNTKGKRGHCPSYRALQDAIKTVINQANKLYPELSTLLYGHSMGGNLVINYALENSDVKAVVATSPLLRLAFNPPKWKVALGRFMLTIFPSITLPSELDASGISRDEIEVKRYQEDTLVHDKISPMYSFPVFDAGEYAITNANKLEIPMLVCHGTGDKITSHEASKEFANNSNNVDLELFEDAYHELHHDFCKQELISTLLKWLNSKI